MHTGEMFNPLTSCLFIGTGLISIVPLGPK